MTELFAGPSSANFQCSSDGVAAASIETHYERLSLHDSHYLRKLGEDSPLGVLSIEEERARMRQGQKSRLIDFPVRMETYQTSACPVHIVKPLHAEQGMPVTFYLHGGGWVLGDLATHTRLVCQLAVESQAAIAFIEYPLAPEHPFPASLEACTAAVNEVLDCAGSLGLDPRRFGVAGDSSGGNLAAALMLSAHEERLPIPLCQVLLYPAIDYSCSTNSYKEFGRNPNLSQKTMKWFWENYLSDESIGTNPLASPLRLPAAALAGFPPTLLITCEYDVLRDEGEQFAARLIRAGVDVTAVRWLGSLHGFLVTESLMASASAKACIEMIARYLKDGYSIEP